MSILIKVTPQVFKLEEYTSFIQVVQVIETSLIKYKMNSLLSYGSDDDLDDSSEEKSTEFLEPASKQLRSLKGKLDGSTVGNTGRKLDVNYDQVQMDVSENYNYHPGKKGNFSQQDSNDDYKNYISSQPSSSASRHRSRDDSRYSTEKFKNNRYYETTKSNSSRYYNESRSSTTNRYDNRRDDKNDYRRERHRSRRSLSRESKQHLRTSKSRSRSRSRSRNHKYNSSNNNNNNNINNNNNNNNSNNNNNNNNNNTITKNRFDQKQSQSQSQSQLQLQLQLQLQSQSQSRQIIEKSNETTITTNTNVNNTTGDQQPKPTTVSGSFIPGVTGRFRDQIERRKLLWQKKEPTTKTTISTTKLTETFTTRQLQSTTNSTTSMMKATKVWETTTFPQDTDGKVANKFKRLMGIKNTPTENSQKLPVDVLKQQEEMFSSMEQQYEVARTATHTMRGMGLGFGSFQR